MALYQWNGLDIKKDLLCVVSLDTMEVLMKNAALEEVEEGLGGQVETLVQTQADVARVWQEAMAFLQANPQETFQTEETHFVLETWVNVAVQAGYCDAEQSQVYLVVKGYEPVVDFLRFQKAMAHVPENIVLLELNDELTLYSGNPAFEETFSTHQTTFAAAFEGSFAGAMVAEHRQAYIDIIRREIMQTGRCCVPMEVFDAAGKRHYVYFTGAMSEGILNHALLCATVQVLDEAMGDYLRLQQENQAYRATSSFTNSVVFRLDLTTGKADFYGELVERFQLNSGDMDFATYVQKKKLVHLEDQAIFKDMLANMRQGIEKKVRLRLNSNDGRSDWYLVQYTIVKDDQGTPLQALGKVTNIQSTMDLQDKASLDLLTGCLNKGSFETAVAELLMADEVPNCACLIIDIDNFKTINDNLGHLFGDIVLKEIASKLKRVFRENDFVGRIGGDEFVVLVRNVDDLAVVERKAKEVITALNITYKGKGTFYRVTASVGVALSPQHGKRYEDLYTRADLALYQAKNLGKNGYCVYQDTLSKGTMENKTPIDVAKRALSAHFNQEIAVNVFNLLFEEGGNSMDMVLSHLGQQFGVDRCYIFELSDERAQTYDNTYEWCAKGIAPQIDVLKNVPLTTFQEVFDQADTDGIYYCNDIDTIQADSTRESLQMQGIESVVLSFLKRGGQVQYVLGFDDCTTKRVWRPVEISTLAYASKIIAQHLRYQALLSKHEQRDEQA